MSKVLGGLKPDITPAQIVALLIAGVPHLLVLFGVELSAAQDGALDQLLFLALGLFGADVLLRGARNYAGAKVEAAALTPAPAPAQSAPGAPVEPRALLASGVAGSFEDDVVDEEERELLQAMEAGELPSDEDEFAPAGHEKPDDPDA